MREAKSAGAILFEYVEPKGKTVLEIGCGTGELARELTARGARVIAIDREAMLAAAASAPRAGNERYVAASGESLPVRDGSADLVLYIASLHHLPSERLDDAMAECRRVLRPGGRAAFIEPVYRRGSYTDLTRLVEDERAVQRLAYQAILRAGSADLEMLVEEPFFIARSFADYETLIATFVEEPAKRPEILGRAKAITAR
ncbi:MAG TPA: class I SAM-dependent methyltransferase, partial [Thermoanaerobaculia bacterium]